MQKKECKPNKDLIFICFPLMTKEKSESPAQQNVTNWLLKQIAIMNKEKMKPLTQCLHSTATNSSENPKKKKKKKETLGQKSPKKKLEGLLTILAESERAMGVDDCHWNHWKNPNQKTLLHFLWNGLFLSSATSLHSECAKMRERE